MRIKEMKLHPIAIADPPLRSSYGLHAPFALRTIVELISTDGLTGISETYGGDAPLAALEAAREHINRKSTRLNSSHVEISYAVFCLKKKKKKNTVMCRCTRS